MGTAARCLGTTLRRVLAAALPLVVVTACATPAFDRGAYLQNAKAALGLGDTEDALAHARIAVRRDDRPALDTARADLADHCEKLQRTLSGPS